MITDFPKLLESYRQKLNSWIFLSMALGTILGLLFPGVAGALSIVGTIFLNLLMMLIVPVIVISMLAGVLNLGSSENIGRMGLKTIGYYTCTTALAVAVGLLVVNTVQPGVDSDAVATLSTSHEQAPKAVASGGIGEVLKKIIPTNIVSAAVQGNVLGLIFFSIFLGIALLKIGGEGVKQIGSIIDTLFQAIIWMIDIIMLLAPPGILALVGALVADFSQNEQLLQLGSAIGWYSLTVIIGLLIHGIVTLPRLSFFFGVHPIKLFEAMLPAVTTAFSTASSAATLPITIDRLEKSAGVSNKTASFVAPLGATVNMDGTAIYEAIAAVFIANMYGVDLSFGQQMIIFLTATFSAVGAAGIPGAGLIMMTIVLNSVGLPIEGIQMIVVVDRALDMLRTSINVWGDSVGAAVIAKSEGDPLSVSRS